jgi:hypothetical protein
MVLALGCPGGGGGGSATPTLEARPKVVEVTAGQQVTLSYSANNLPAGGVEILLPDPDSGHVDESGLYTAPFKVGTYHAVVRSRAIPGLQDRSEIHVHAAPIARSFTADRTRIKPGESVALTADFDGGKAVLYPGALDLASGTPVTLKPVQDTTYILRVTSTLGVVAEKTLLIQVEGMLRHLNNIVAPDVARVGNYHVAWVERRVGAQLEWSSDEVVFLGGQEHPTTPVVVFTPKPGVSTYKLKVRARGGNQLAPLASSLFGRSAVSLARAGHGPRALKQAGPRGVESPVDRAGDLPGHLDVQAQEEVTFEVEGKVELPTGDEPVIRLERPFFTAGKSGCKAWVENEKPDTTYVWSVQHGPSQEPVGPKVGLTAGQGDFMLITCKATVPGGQPRTTTTAVGLLQAPPPPVIRVGGEPVAGVRQHVYVKGGNPGDTQHWEMEPGKGVLDAASGPTVGFTVREPGPFKLICRTETQAGEMSEPATLTLTAVGPFSLDPPKVLWPDYLRADTDSTLAVDNPPPGMVFDWKIELGGTATSPTSGATLNLRTGNGAEPLLVMCTAREPGTGATSTASRTFTLVTRPSTPVILAPDIVPPGTDQVASVAYGPRPGEWFEWEEARENNAALQPSPQESGPAGAGRDDRRVVVFRPGDVGRYFLKVRKVNQAGDRSDPYTFEGRVAVPGVMAAGAGGAPEAPETAPARLYVSYPSLVRGLNGDVRESPELRPDMGDNEFRLVDSSTFPRELNFNPRTGAITGTLRNPGTYRFQVAARSGSLTGMSNYIVFQVNADAAGSGSGQEGDLSISYENAEFRVGDLLDDSPRTPRVLGGRGTLSYRIAQGALPEGMTFSERTGAIAGSPSRAGLSSFKVEVRDESGRAPAISGIISFAVAGADLALAYPPPPALEARKAMDDQAPTVTGYIHELPAGTPESVPRDPRLVYEVVGLMPRGLQLDPTTGVIRGTPLEACHLTFTIRVRDWHRHADASLTYDVGPAVQPGISYPAAQYHTRSRIQLSPVRMGEDLVPFITWATDPADLPPGLQFDANTGDFTGTIATAGDYPFRVIKRVQGAMLYSNIPVDETYETSVVLHVANFLPLAITRFDADQYVVDPGGRATLTFEYQGTPDAMSLYRDQLPWSAEGAVVAADQDPFLFRTIKPSGSSETVQVNRRQVFTLELKEWRERTGLFVRAGTRELVPMERKVALAARGMESVSGLAIDDMPWRGYADGPQDDAILPEIAGLAWTPGGLFVSEGSQQTVRRFSSTDNQWHLFKGVPQGPDEGTPAAPAARLHGPGPMVVHNGVLYLADVDSHTIKQVPVDGSADVTICAGQRNVSANPPAGHPAGVVDGPAATALFGRIMDLAVYNGVLYVADFDRGIRMIDLATSQVTTLHQGNGGYRIGVDNHGRGTQAWTDFRSPVALAVAGPGPRPSIYLVSRKDANGVDVDQVIQVLHPGDATNGLVTTHWELIRLAGYGRKGYANGGRDDALFKSLTSLAVAGNGLLATDPENHAIRWIDRTTGQVETLAGSPPAGSVAAGRTVNPTRASGQRDDPADGLEARFDKPSLIVPGGNPDEFYVADFNGQAIRRIVRTAGGALHAMAVSTLYRPRPIRVPDSFMVMRRVPGNRGLEDREFPGTLSEYLKAQNGPGDRARFEGPVGVVVERSTGDAFVADMRPHAVRRVMLQGTRHQPAGTVSTFAGELHQPFGARAAIGGPAAGAGPAAQPLNASKLLYPTEVTMDGLGRMYILENSGLRIRLVDQGRVHIFLAGLPAVVVRPGEIPPGSHIAARPGGDNPQLLAVSHPDLATPGHWQAAVCQVPPRTNAVTLASFQNVPLPYPALQPRALAFSLDGRLHVAQEDRANQRCWIQTFELQSLPAPGWVPVGAPVGFGPGLAADPFQNLGFPEVEAMAADSRGNLFLTDSANGTVWMVPANGAGRVVLLAGAPPVRRVIGPDQAQPFTRSLLHPQGIAVTAYDDLVVVDGNQVLQITAPGTADFPYVPPAGPGPAWVTQNQYNAAPPRR